MLCNELYNKIIKIKTNSNTNKSKIFAYHNLLQNKDLISQMKYSDINKNKNIIFIVVGSTEIRDIKDRIEFLISSLKEIDSNKNIHIVFSGYGGIKNMSAGVWTNSNKNHSKIKEQWVAEIKKLELDDDTTEAQLMLKLFLDKINKDTNLKDTHFNIYCDNFAIETVGNGVLSNIILNNYSGLSNNDKQKSVIIGITAWYHSCRLHYLLENFFNKYADVYTPINTIKTLHNSHFGVGYWNYLNSNEGKVKNNINQCEFIVKSLAEAFEQTFSYSNGNKIFNITDSNIMTSLFLTNHGLYNDRVATTLKRKKKIIHEITSSYFNTLNLENIINISNIIKKNEYNNITFNQFIKLSLKKSYNNTVD